MKNWRNVAKEFLESWKKKKEVLGALYSGSRVWGTNDKFSDIDIHIVLSNSAKYRVRGNEIIDKYLIEYFANPIKQLKEYRKNDFKNYTRIDARMFAYGEIAFDKTGELKKLQDKCKNELKKEFKDLPKLVLNLSKYELWDELDNLRSVEHSKHYTYSYCYNLLLNKTYSLYRKFLKAESPPPAKLNRFFDDSIFRKKYKMPAFPDKKFIALFKKCLQREKLNDISRLVEYVLEKTGGFKVDGWKLRSKPSYE